MSMFDKASWKRAFTPAFRAFAYFTAIYVILVIILLVPYNILLAVGSNLSSIFSALYALSAVFAFFIAFFKVLDEDRPGDIPLKMA